MQNSNIPLSPAQLYQQNRQRQAATGSISDDPMLTQAAAAYGAMPGNEGLVMGSLIDVSQMAKARPAGVPEDVLLHPATGQPLVDPNTGLYLRREPHKTINPPLPMGEGVEWVVLKDFQTTFNGHTCRFSAGEILHDKEQILTLKKQNAPIKPQVVQVMEQYAEVEDALAQTKRFLEDKAAYESERNAFRNYYPPENQEVPPFQPDASKEAEAKEAEEQAKAAEAKTKNAAKNANKEG